ncbi:MAG: flagellar hook capping FlgD N-terminal domain-containing protein [Novosphingobium sp.]
MTTIVSDLPTTPSATAYAGSFGSLGQKDFLRLLTTQLQAQDPFEPVDNKELLAQMAQFSSLAGISDINATLQDIGDKLDNSEVAVTLQALVARLDAVLAAGAVPAEQTP